MNSVPANSLHKGKISLLITDDHKLLRETWNHIFNLDARFNVVGSCGCGEEAVELARRLKPNVILMDINLPVMNGFEATELIGKCSPTSKVIGVSLHSQPSYARKLIKLGAKGYVTKNSPVSELMKAVIDANEGRSFICEEIKSILSDQLLTSVDHQKQLNQLTEREKDVIELLKDGSSSKVIASKLNIAVKTVEVHRYNVLRKLNLKNVAALINFMNQNVAN